MTDADPFERANVIYTKDVSFNYNTDHQTHCNVYLKLQKLCRDVRGRLRNATG